MAIPADDFGIPPSQISIAKAALDRRLVFSRKLEKIRACNTNVKRAPTNADWTSSVERQRQSGSRRERPH